MNKSKKGKIELRLLFGYLLVWLLIQQASSDPLISCSDPNIWVYSNGYRCCRDISCPPGQQPIACSEGDPSSSSCERCPHDQYNPDYAHLRNKDRCKLKVICDPMYNLYIKEKGDETHNAECACFPGYVPVKGANICIKAPNSDQEAASIETTTTRNASDDTAIFETETTATGMSTLQIVLLVVSVVSVVGIIILSVVVVLLKKRGQRHQGSQPPATNGVLSSNHDQGTTELGPLIPPASGEDRGYALQQKILQICMGSSALDRLGLQRAIRYLEVHLGDKWMSLGRQLFYNVERPVMEYIEAETRGQKLEDCIACMMKKWMETRGEQATMENLIKALRTCGFHLLVGSVCEDVYVNSLREASKAV